MNAAEEVAKVTVARRVRTVRVLGIGPVETGCVPGPAGTGRCDLLELVPG